MEPVKNAMDAMAERIKHGIAQIGVQVIAGDDLAVIWNHHEAATDCEKRLHLGNFATTYGFEVHLNTLSQVALFRDSTKAINPRQCNQEGKQKPENMH